MFDITEKKIDGHAFYDDILSSDTGALVVFNGIVRDINHNKKVTKIVYEAYDQMVRKQAKKIMTTIKDSHEILNAVAIHRKGEIVVGESAVIVAVTSRHRKEAFAACEEIMDTFKHLLPIWKKEFYETGESEWVHCSH